MSKLSCLSIIISSEWAIYRWQLSLLGVGKHLDTEKGDQHGIKQEENFNFDSRYH